jgi:nucleotide-binding universal stress UspA family protein
MCVVESVQSEASVTREADLAATRILVPLDGTPYAEAALRPVVTIARACNADVVLVQASARGTDAGASERGMLRRHDRETRHRASLYLARIEQELQTRGVRTSTRVPVGSAAEAIVAVALETHADLIVIATHAGGGLSRPSQVSIARKLVRHTTIPMLLLSSTTRNPFERAGGMGLTMVIPLDGSADGECALPCAHRLARTFGARMLLLRTMDGAATHALPHDDPRPRAVPPQQTRTAAIAYLDTVRDQLSANAIPVWTGVTEGDLYQESARQAQAGAELIVIGVHGDTAHQERIVDSAVAVMRHSRTPVMLVRQH